MTRFVRCLGLPNVPGSDLVSLEQLSVWVSTPPTNPVRFIRVTGTVGQTGTQWRSVQQIAYDLASQPISASYRIVMDDGISGLAGNKSLTLQELKPLLDAVINSGPLQDFRTVLTRGSRMQLAEGASAGNDTAENRYRERFAFSTSEIKFLFTNTYLASTTPGAIETLNASDIPVQSAIEYEVPAAFAGNTTTVPANTGFVASASVLPASFSKSEFAANDMIWLRSSTKMPTGNWLTGLHSIGPAGEAQYRHAPAAQQAFGTGALVQTGGAARRGYMPLCVIGRAPVGAKSLFVIGDSLAEGSADVQETTEGAFGHIQRACMYDGVRSVASLNMGRGGDTAAQFLLAAEYRLSLARFHTHAIVQFGVNDYFNLGRTKEQILADLIAIVVALKMRGIQKVAVANLIPKTTGTYTTTAGQVAAPGYTECRAFVDAGLRAAPQVDIVLDASTACSDSVDPTKFPANATSDGVHPNGGTPAYAALVTATKAVLTAWGF